MARGLGRLIALNEGPWRWGVGLQAGIAMALPLVVFALAGHQSIGLMASLGAFTALYCVRLSRWDRLRALPLVAAGLVAASVIGVMTAWNAWLTIAGLVIVTAIACVLTIGVGLGAPGPLMFVLVAGVSGHLVAPPELGGVSVEAFLLPAVVAVGGTIAYLVVVVPLVLPAVRRREEESEGLRSLFPAIHFDQVTMAISARVVTAVALAGILSLPLGVHRSYWVIIAAIAVLQNGHNRKLTSIRAVHRVVGTILGVIVFGGIVLAGIHGWWLILVIPVLQFATEVVVARHYGLALVFITPLALLISTSAGSEDPLQVVQQRIFDTVLGAVIALAVFWVGVWINSLRNRVGSA